MISDLLNLLDVLLNLSYSRFKKEYPDKSSYLKPKTAGPNVLISKHFWYFGDKAIRLPKKLELIIIDRQGCKCVSNEDIEILKEYLASNPNFKITGKPNNPVLKPFKKNC